MEALKPLQHSKMTTHSSSTVQKEQLSGASGVCCVATASSRCLIHEQDRRPQTDSDSSTFLNHQAPAECIDVWVKCSD
ncbi:uncharacterized protein V6R79_013881 [Siganus canaliculatus]